MDFCTINEAAKRGPVPVCRLRQWVKEGRVPGFYSGKWFYVDYEQFIAQIYADCGTMRRSVEQK